MPKRPSGKRITAPDGTVRVRGKNANGDGSLYALADGTWRATWYDTTGKLRTVRGRTRAQAVERRAERIEDDRAGRLTSFGRATTVAELAGWWLENVAAQRVRPSSLGKYRDRVERINAAMGGAPVATLRAEGVAGWLAQLQRDGLSSGTTRDTRTVLRQVLDQAVDLGLVQANVAARARGPKVERRDGRALSVEDARRLLDAARTDRLGAAVWLLFVNGWRVSEVLGLAWDDVDLAASTATVRRAAVYVDGVGTVLGPTKTAGARGEHRLSPGVVALLRARRQTQAAERLAAGPVWRSVEHEGRPVALVFTTSDGGLVNRQAVTKAVKRCALAAGLDPQGLGTHAGRRTVVTGLYAAEGVDLADIARHVGHTDPGTTAGYVRDLGARPARTAEAARRLFDQQ